MRTLSAGQFVSTCLTVGLVLCAATGCATRRVARTGEAVLPDGGIVAAVGSTFEGGPDRGEPHSSKPVDLPEMADAAPAAMLRPVPGAPERRDAPEAPSGEPTDLVLAHAVAPESPAASGSAPRDLPATPADFAAGPEIAPSLTVDTLQSAVSSGDVPAPVPALPVIQRDTASKTAAGFREITIEPDCVLEIGVEEDPSLNGSYAVDMDGGIDFGYVGLVVLQNATAREAERKIRALLKGRYTKTATVRVRITKASYDKVKVAGAVVSPGMLKIGSGAGISLEEALIRAGGISTEGEEIKIKIVPGGARSVIGGPASPEGRVVKLTVSADGVTVPDVNLYNQDLIYVFSAREMASEIGKPKQGSKTIIVLGEVPRAGPITFKPNEPCTLLCLLFRIGGLSDFARASSIRIKRTNGDGEEEVIKANGERLLKTGDPSIDVPLMDGDRVIVPAKTFSFF